MRNKIFPSLSKDGQDIILVEINSHYVAVKTEKDLEDVKNCGKLSEYDVKNLEELYEQYIRKGKLWRVKI